MAKKTATNIVEVWNWLINVMESGELTATEQAALVHVIARINRNMWTPTKINPKLIAAAIDKDARTVKTALSKIVNLNILTMKDGVYYLGNVRNNKIPANDDGGKLHFRSQHDANNRTIQQDPSRNDGAVDSGTNPDGEEHSAQTKPAGKRRRLFNANTTEEP